MTEYRRTWEITGVDWNTVFKAYEKAMDCVIDGAVDIRCKWYEENKDMIGKRHGACTVYFNGDSSIFGTSMFRDEILSDLGISLGYEEVN